MKNKRKQRTNGMNRKHLQTWYVNPTKSIIILKENSLKAPIKRKRLSE